ncbi:MAG: hypothetical protein RL091_850 [Verrucomicrobiota bacterium]|jgi:hypothetical protein
MKEQLAERLLARVMNWRAEDVARERPILQAMAAYKYDEYQQFKPGMRFVESLALWLNDFTDPKHKEEAYKFVRERLLFFSTAEINHLVSIAYPDFIRPRLLHRVAADTGISKYYLGRLLETQALKIRQRSCLFLGLSDGARTDIFRRANEGVITHEQVLQTYEVKAQRGQKLLEKLRKDLTTKIAPGVAGLDKARFSTLVLQDDFSGSGTSYLRSNGDSFEGKLQEMAADLLNPESEAAKLFDCANTQVLLVLYIATEQALKHIRDALAKIWGGIVNFEVIAIHPLPESIRIKPGDSLDGLLDAHYEPDVMEDEHTKKGGKTIKYGYAECGLPLVLSHNSPNNSIYPVWNTDGKLRPLFPRVSRHKQP